MPTPDNTTLTATASPGMGSRKEWRHSLRSRRRAISAGDAQLAAHSALTHLQASSFWQAQHIALYIANDGELDPGLIASAARDAGKALYLPIVADERIQFCRWHTDDPLTQNRFGIGEPAGEAVAAERLDLLLLPLVGWTSCGFRLGMGGGYYDRFLAEHERSHLPRLGLGYECQREDQLATLQANWDQPLDGVLTERGLYSIGKSAAQAP